MHSSAHGSMGTRALLVRSDRCRTGVHRPRSDRPAEPGATNGLSNSSRLARSSFIPVRYGLLLYLRRMMSVRRCGRGFHRMCSCSSSSAWSQSQFTCRRRRLPSAQSTSARKIQIQNRRRQRIRFICALTGWAQVESNSHRNWSRRQRVCGLDSLHSMGYGSTCIARPDGWGHS